MTTTERPEDQTAQRPRARRSRWRVVAVIYRYLLATVAVAALVVGALALRDNADEQRTQSRCSQALAYAATKSPDARTRGARPKERKEGFRTVDLRGGACPK